MLVSLQLNNADLCVHTSHHVWGYKATHDNVITLNNSDQIKSHHNVTGS